MAVQDVIAQARDSLTVKRVFGESYEKNGVTVIPAARIQGGAGGGGGEGPEGQGKGSGSGFGLSARPAGAYVIRGDKVAWRPALDVNRIILGAQIVAVVAFLSCRSVMKARAKARVAGRASGCSGDGVRRMADRQGIRCARIGVVLRGREGARRRRGLRAS